MSSRLALFERIQKARNRVFHFACAPAQNGLVGGWGGARYVFVFDDLADEREQVVLIQN